MTFILEIDNFFEKINKNKESILNLDKEAHEYVENQLSLNKDYKISINIIFECMNDIINEYWEDDDEIPIEGYKIKKLITYHLMREAIVEDSRYDIYTKYIKFRKNIYN
jgi:hypothetical protein